jgi:putative addiction module component (TIGR02574 family)
MSATLKAVEAAALQLSSSDRERLVEKLIASLDTDPEIEEAWAAEVQRRRLEIERGEMAPIGGPEALATLKDSLR